jgi:antitoxin HicB
MKNLEHYLSLNYRKIVYQDEDGDYIIEVPDLPGCAADGVTPDEAFANLRDSMSSWFESRIEAGLAIPEPKNPESYSGKLLLRMPKFLHRRLAEQAETQETSLNQYVVALLSDASARAAGSALNVMPVGLLPADVWSSDASINGAFGVGKSMWRAYCQMGHAQVIYNVATRTQGQVRGASPNWTDPTIEASPNFQDQFGLPPLGKDRPKQLA